MRGPHLIIGGDVGKIASKQEHAPVVIIMVGWRQTQPKILEEKLPPHRTSLITYISLGHPHLMHSSPPIK